MIETIPSRWMRDYLKKVNRELSDKEKATMIWNVPNVTWNERLDSLKELGDETEDHMLQEQIRERIDIVNIGLHFFLKNVRPYAASCNES